jgi:hypothetical protein
MRAATMSAMSAVVRHLSTVTDTDTPVEFVARCPMFFRAARVEAGQRMLASMPEALELMCSPRAALVNSDDAERIRHASHRAAAELAKGAPRGKSWVHAYTRN